MEEFHRIKRLPPYVFAIVDDLKMKARRRGDDIIDLGMGNPDFPTPPHIVDKLIEAAGEVIGDLRDPHTGVAFVIDVERTFGIKAVDQPK